MMDDLIFRYDAALTELLVADALVVLIVIYKILSKERGTNQKYWARSKAGVGDAQAVPSRPALETDAPVCPD